MLYFHISGQTVVISRRVVAHACAIQSPCAALRHAASAGGPQPGAAKNHICLDKNRSMPRNQIQKQREIPNKVVQYADHTATGTTAASLFASFSAEVNVARLCYIFRRNVSLNRS